MANLSGLQNISSINLNTSSLTGGNFIDDTMTIFMGEIPYWLFFVTFILFLTMTWYINKNPVWRLDIAQSMLVSSLLQIIISYAVIKIGWSVSLVPLAFWGFIWIIMLITMFYIKKRG